MKKNNMLRIASVLLVAVLLSTCAISGAFAKYTTSADADDSARVALFGFEVTATGGEAFGTMYAEGTQSEIYTPGVDELASVTAAATTVKTTVDDVVAPGTKGTLATFTYGGTAEVDVTVTRSVVLDLANGKWLDKEGNFYCPLIISVGGNPIKMEGDIDTEAEFEAAVAAAVENTTIEAGETLSESTLAITWEWPISTSAENDVKDTFLAKTANYAGNTIALTASVTIEQID